MKHPDAELERRIMAIAGCHNLRDLGGYRTADGRSLRWRTLYRSGRMAPLSDAGLEAMAQLGVAAIFDLRTTRERSREPVMWHVDRGVHYYCRDYEMSVGNLQELKGDAGFSSKAARDAMRAIYDKLPYEQVPAYRDLFQLLASGRVPLIFNCSAGKDRTGLAAALILSALGVPHATIEQDYALTNQSLDGLSEMVRSNPDYGHLASQPREAYLPLLQADPEYLSAAFAAIESRSGGIEGYLKNDLGLAGSDIENLRSRLIG